ncbi:hypothetical protein OV079_18130 [Nannocystis pusilla]|uniref:Uncharacterized protein n=1 Tax=Nannocystis pusilla TaxID=889268 RepID=A0A9X3ENP1_9BACT|nr:hypothetical protein [Nannocystis pusilla]MCY1007433.1 hypothetical protein [Nannocystis pusilla]
MVLRCPPRQPERIAGRGLVANHSLWQSGARRAQPDRAVRGLVANHSLPAPPVVRSRQRIGQDLR